MSLMFFRSILNRVKGPSRRKKGIGEHRENGLPAAMRDYRDFIANKYLSGEGIEIGPGNAPIRLTSETTKITYVDFASKDDLVNVHGYAEDWTEPDIIDDGDTLSSINDLSLNFIIACHVLEHTQDPLRVLQTWLAKLRPGGLAFIAIPDRRYCFDKDRPLTPFSHLLSDHEHGPGRSEEAHLHEWVTLVNGVVDEEAIELQKSEIKRIDYRIHYHVWDTTSFIEMLTRCAANIMKFEIEHCGRNDTEAVAVLKKC